MDKEEILNLIREQKDEAYQAITDCETKFEKQFHLGSFIQCQLILETIDKAEVE